MSAKVDKMLVRLEPFDYWDGQPATYHLAYSPLTKSEADVLCKEGLSSYLGTVSPNYMNEATALICVDCLEALREPE